MNLKRMENLSSFVNTVKKLKKNFLGNTEPTVSLSLENSVMSCIPCYWFIKYIHYLGHNKSNCNIFHIKKKHVCKIALLFPWWE